MIAFYLSLSVLLITLKSYDAYCKSSLFSYYDVSALSSTNINKEECDCGLTGRTDFVLYCQDLTCYVCKNSLILGKNEIKIKDVKDSNKEIITSTNFKPAIISEVDLSDKYTIAVPFIHKSRSRNVLASLAGVFSDGLKNLIKDDVGTAETLKCMIMPDTQAAIKCNKLLYNQVDFSIVNPGEEVRTVVKENIWLVIGAGEIASLSGLLSQLPLLTRNSWLKVLITLFNSVESMNLFWSESIYAKSLQQLNLFDPIMEGIDEFIIEDSNLFSLRPFAYSRPEVFYNTMAELWSNANQRYKWDLYTQTDDYKKFMTENQSLIKQPFLNKEIPKDKIINIEMADFSQLKIEKLKQDEIEKKKQEELES